MAAIALVLAVGVPWGCSAIQQAGWDANSGVHEVAVLGNREGDGYRISDTATVETWAEHNEMSVRLYVERTDDDRRTPLLAVEIGENGNRCETARSWIWSTNEGSTLDLACMVSYDLEDLREIDSIRLVPYDE
jgi:hypothetical protein